MTVLPEGAIDTELYLACPACVSFSAIDSRDEATTTIDSHNERAHNDEEIARTLNTRDMDELSAFVEAVKEHASGDQYQNFLNRMFNGNTTFFCSSAIYKAAVPADDQ